MLATILDVVSCHTKLFEGSMFSQNITQEQSTTIICTCHAPCNDSSSVVMSRVTIEGIEGVGGGVWVGGKEYIL